MDTSYAFADPRAQTVWANKLFDYSLPNMVVSALMGSTPDAFIHVDKDLIKKPGATIVFKGDDLFDNAGVGDDGDTTGSEGQIKTRNMSLITHERANATKSAGHMSEKLTNSKFRPDSMRKLGNWIKEAVENDVATAIFGLYNENSSSSEIETINESYPTSNRIFYGGQSVAGTIANSGASYTTDALLSAEDAADTLMGTRLLSAVRRRAVAAVPRFRGAPIPDVSRLTPKDIRMGVQGPMVSNQPWYAVFLHPYHIKSIREETATTGWAQMTAAAQQRGNLNPIFTGAAFLWDGMVCYEYDRVPYRTGANGTTLAEGFLLNAGRTATTDPVANGKTVARAVLLGAQACCFGWGMMPTWSEDYYDNDKLKVKTAMIYGVKRTTFNAHGTSTAGDDEAIYCIDTQVQVDA